MFGAAQPVGSNPKVSDLPQDLRQRIFELDNFISDQQRRCEAVQELCKDWPSKLAPIKEQGEQIQQKSKACKMLQERTLYSIRSVKDEVNDTLKNAEQAARLWERLSHSDSLHPVAVSPSPFLVSTDQSFESRLHLYRQQISELQQLLSIYANQDAHSQLSPHVLEEILKSQYESFILLSSQVANLHEQENDIKDMFRTVCRSDALEAADEEEKQVAQSMNAPTTSLSNFITGANMAAPQAAPAAPSPFGGQNLGGPTFSGGSFGAASLFPSSSSSMSSSSMFNAQRPGGSMFGAPGGGMFGASSSSMFGGSSSSSGMFGAPSSSMFGAPSSGSSFASSSFGAMPSSSGGMFAAASSSSAFPSAFSMSTPGFGQPSSFGTPSAAGSMFATPGAPMGAGMLQTPMAPLQGQKGKKKSGR
eukprot:GILK01008087.1.p1 GENE.GILK01008087.1~~GILK01008087.1.p1  ORF type:complete len:418 (+),score=58.94 GILK01008087.1:35-1288(+)